ncbi:hypothetical protein LTR17_005122 [Elasticomyces elasticus]|nr:hypothetical protein LTR17_005122 [Elasticomyces elasticus]
MGKRPRTSSEMAELTDGPTAKKRKTARSKQTPTKVNSTTSSMLFELPAELRIIIWECALLEDLDIIVNKHLRIPSLLRVSKQVREETTSIWYNGNTFTHLIPDCNSSLVATWIQHCRALGFRQVRDAALVTGHPDWPNLMKWCEVLCGPSSPGMVLSVDDESDELERVVATVTGIAVKFWTWGRTWAECRSLLDEMRPLLGFYDQYWLK